MSGEMYVSEERYAAYSAEVVGSFFKELLRPDNTIGLEVMSRFTSGEEPRYILKTLFMAHSGVNRLDPPDYELAEKFETEFDRVLREGTDYRKGMMEYIEAVGLTPDKMAEIMVTDTDASREHLTKCSRYLRENGYILYPVFVEDAEESFRNTVTGLMSGESY